LQLEIDSQRDVWVGGESQTVVRGTINGAGFC